MLQCLKWSNVQNLCPRTEKGDKYKSEFTLVKTFYKDDFNLA